MKKNLIFVMTALIAASLACNFGGIGSGGGDGGTSQPDNVLFQDDFSNIFSGWDSVSDDDGVTDYKDGAYRIQVNTIGTQGNGMDMWGNPGLNFDEDVRVEVDATKTAGPDDNDMGVMCRYDDSGDTFNFYYFLISSDGYIAILKMKDSSSEVISGDEWELSDAVKTGNATNHIRGDCIGSELTMYVNGQKVATASDSDFTKGDVGLMAGTFETPGTDILFDNFLVTKP
jgi:hypothetical protein